MSRFQFAYRTLQRVRKIAEDQAQIEQMRAKKALKQHLDYIDQLYLQIDQTRETIQQKQQQGRGGAEIQPLEEFIEGQRQRIEQERLKAREFMSKEEKATNIYLEAYKKRKVIDLLFERRRKEFESEQKRKENQMIEEVVTMKYRGRQ